MNTADQQAAARWEALTQALEASVALTARLEALEARVAALEALEMPAAPSPPPVDLDPVIIERGTPKRARKGKK